MDYIVKLGTSVPVSEARRWITHAEAVLDKVYDIAASLVLNRGERCELAVDLYAHLRDIEEALGQARIWERAKPIKEET